MSVYVIFNIKGHAGEMKVPKKEKKETSKSEKGKKGEAKK